MIDNLLQIWDLDKEDLESIAPDLCYGTCSSSPLCGMLEAEASKCDSESTGRCCGSCHALNLCDANWCIECGVSLLGLQKFQSVEKARERPYESNVMPAQCECFLPDDCDCDVTATSLTQSNKSPKRHWETSGFYAWRKPASRRPVCKNKLLPKLHKVC